MNISEIGKQKVLFSSIDNSIDIKSYFIKNVDNVDSEKIEDFQLSPGLNKQTAIQKFVEKIYDIESDTEDCDKHEVDMHSDDYIGYYSSLLLLREDNDKSQFDFVMVLNARIKQVIPLYSHYILKAIIEKSCGHSININYTHYPLPMTNDLKQSKSFGNSLAVIFFIAIALSLMPANFITVYVRERINNTKHLMRISGINIFSYWIINYIFELVKYYFSTGICIFLLWAFDYYEKYLYILYITFGPSMISLTYSLSFFFDNESNAQNAIILINFLFGYLGSIIVGVLRGMDATKKVGKII